MAKKLPKLPKLLESKIYKTGQTRGADDDVIYQNRVGRNGTVLIPFECIHLFDFSTKKHVFENGFIVLIKPEDYFDNPETLVTMKKRELKLGINSLLFYETRFQWNNYNPTLKKLKVADSRISPLNGDYVARVPSTTSKSHEKIILGFNSSGLKGAGIRIYEYADSETMKLCRYQLEYLFWLCIDSIEVAINAGMSTEEITERKFEVGKICDENGLADLEKLYDARMIDNENNTVCPLCLEKLSANGFLSKLIQAEGRNVPDLTVTQINLFHIRELKIGEYNHKTYNLGWGHHHCNVVCKDSGIFETIKWMKDIITKNVSLGY
jgi:BstXI restriction endonuclease